MPALPPLQWLRAFEAAARHLSFTAAAGELGLTQSAVSQHVRSLEHRLGRQLFERRPRALEPTEAGRTYLRVVQEAFGVLARGTASFAGEDRGQRLRLNCNLAFSVLWLAPRLARLNAAHPWLTLEIATYRWGPQGAEAETGPEIRSSLPSALPSHAVSLGEERCFPVAAPTGPTDWTTAPLYDCTAMLGNWQSWAEAGGQTPPNPSRITLATSYTITVTAALHGAGIAMAHGRVARGLLTEGRLQRLGHDAPMPEVYALIPPPAHAATPASRAFCDWLLTENADG
ncbi:MAG: LysR family transcriptional regulator [Pseudomonadota bacterium]